MYARSKKEVRNKALSDFSKEANQTNANHCSASPRKYTPWGAVVVGMAMAGGGRGNK